MGARKAAIKANETETARIQEVINGDPTSVAIDTAENTTRRVTKAGTGREHLTDVADPRAPAPTRILE